VEDLFDLKWSKSPKFHSEVTKQRKSIMTKADLVDVIADSADLSKTKAEEAINLLLDSIKASVAKGNAVQLIGFGSFSLGSRAARMGRNPKTGEAIKIAASKTIKFSAGKTFKDIVNRR